MVNLEIVCLHVILALLKGGSIDFDYGGSDFLAISTLVYAGSVLC